MVQNYGNWIRHLTFREGVKETVGTVHSTADGQSALLTQFITSRMSARLSGRPRMGKPAKIWSLQTKLQSTSGRLAKSED